MYIQEFWDKIYFPSPSAFCPETRGPWTTSLTWTTIDLYFTLSNKIVAPLWITEVAISKTILLIKQFKN